MKARRLPEGVEELARIFAENGHTLYLVGGFVRNSLMELPGGDLDVCSDAYPDAAALFLRAAGAKVIEKAIELGTIETHLTVGGRKYIFEHTTFRHDVYPEGGAHRPRGVAFTQSIEEDARRRDFTVNALYLDIRNGRILDPTGRGRADIQSRLIRAAADDPDVTIRDDGLRLMRLARFAAELGCDVSPELMVCAKKRAHFLRDISAERKRDELMKILMADMKYPTTPPMISGNRHKHGLLILRQIGALPYVLPRLCEGDGVMQSEAYHEYDVLGHGIHACAAAPPVPALRLAALLHDIGKPAALIKGGNMHGHEILGAALAEEELTALRFNSRIKKTVVTLIQNHMFDLEAKARPKTIRRRAVMLGKEVFSLLIALRRADVIGSGKDVGEIPSADNWQKELDRMIKDGVPWQLGDLAITGEDIMAAAGIPESPAVGRILDALFRECVAHPGLNTPDTLKSRAKVLARSMLP